MTPLYKRVLIKLSGEALSKSQGLEVSATEECALRIQEVKQLGTEIAVVIGGGNLWRGGRDQGLALDRQASDSIGMIATIMNALCLQQCLKDLGMDVSLMCPFFLPNLARAFNTDLANQQLQQGKVVLLAGGTGHPYFTTDTAAALRAVQLGVDALLKATQVDGLYDKDPNKHSNAILYSTVTHDEVIEKGLKLMDSSAFQLCKEHKMNIRVFNKNEPQAFRRAVTDLEFGSTVSS